MVIRTSAECELKDPSVLSVLFSDTRMATAWLVVRLWLGWTWFDDGRQKVMDAAWMEQGEALRRYWAQVTAEPAWGGSAVADGWHGAALRFMLDNSWYGWMGKAIAVGEVVIGLALLLGLFTGLAALLGALLTFTFLMAGSADPATFIVALGLVAAWKVAGYIGLDAYVLPRLGAPWRAGLFWDQIRPAGGLRRPKRRPKTCA